MPLYMRLVIFHCSVGSVKQLVISYYKRAKKNRNKKQKRVQRLKVDIKLVEV